MATKQNVETKRW